MKRYLAQYTSYHKKLHNFSVGGKYRTELKYKKKSHKSQSLINFNRYFNDIFTNKNIKLCVKLKIVSSVCKKTVSCSIIIFYFWPKGDDDLVRNVYNDLKDTRSTNNVFAYKWKTVSTHTYSCNMPNVYIIIKLNNSLNRSKVQVFFSLIYIFRHRYVMKNIFWWFEDVIKTLENN